MLSKKACGYVYIHAVTKWSRIMENVAKPGENYSLCMCCVTVKVNSIYKLL